EGPHPPSPRRWPAERRRRRAGPSRLARSKGPPAHRDDHRRKQKGNFARPRSRPHVVTPAADSTDNKAAAGRGARAERKTPPRAGLKYWDERTQRVLEPVPRGHNVRAPRRFRPSHKKFSAAAVRGQQREIAPRTR